MHDRLRRAAFTALLTAAGAGALLVRAGATSHPPDAAPLPARTFSVVPALLPPWHDPPTPAPTHRHGDEAARPCVWAPGSARIAIPSLCVQGPVVVTGSGPAGEIAVPEDVHEVGLWSGGQQVTDARGRPFPTGTTLLVGHVDFIGQGDGALHSLYQVAPGAAAYLTDQAGRVTRWRVVALRVVRKTALPGDVFAGRAGPRRLVLVTCGGPVLHLPGYGNTYADNIIATAVPA